MTTLKLTILVIDDEAHILDFLAEEIALEGHSAITASSVTKALEVIERNSIDMILSDVRMPHESGLEILTKTNLPVVFMSGFAEITEEEAIARGALAMIPKPFDFAQLMSIIEERLQRDRRDMRMAG